MPFADWWIEAARTAYFQQDFQRQASCARRALAARTGSTKLPQESTLTTESGVLKDGVAVEALRWIGDAEARLMFARATAPAEVQAKGMLTAVRALGLVAASPFGRSKDWIGFVSLVESLGLVRTSLAANLVAAKRLPADAELRQSIRSLLWGIGRADSGSLAASVSAYAGPRDLGTTVWFVGYAHLLEAEGHRRAERPGAAIHSYEMAATFFSRAGLQESLAASCNHYVGVSWLGRGMAHLLAVRQPKAADALVEAAKAGATIRAAKDGLDRDVFDLVDQALEWRAGRPSPVDAIDLVDRLEKNDPGTGFWAAAVSDTMLREGLRADGKNPRRIERETVDASGETIVMPMGLPTELGDRYLADAVAAGRRAVRFSDGDRKPLAQALTILGERALERLTHGDGATATRLGEARAYLRAAAQAYDRPVPAEDADRATLEEAARGLRAKLGPARPRFREGR